MDTLCLDNCMYAHFYAGAHYGSLWLLCYVKISCGLQRKLQIHTFPREIRFLFELWLLDFWGFVEITDEAFADGNMVLFPPVSINRAAYRAAADALWLFCEICTLSISVHRRFG